MFVFLKFWSFSYIFQYTLLGDLMKTFSNFIKGIFIGSGAILPGISSGVICMVLGLYEKILNSVLNFFKDIKNNFLFLFPIGSGMLLGILIFSNIILYCFNVIPCQTKSLFIGLLLGSIFLLANSNIKNENYQDKKYNYLYFIICFLIGLGLIYLENITKVDTEYVSNQFSTLFLIFSGFLMSLGIVIPGVSSTVILMIIGVYPTYLSAMSIINMNVIFPMMIGAGIGSIIFMKIIQKLLNNYHTQTIFGIIGFSLGSVLILCPTYAFNLETFISIILLVLGFIIGKSIK